MIEEYQTKSKNSNDSKLITSIIGDASHFASKLWAVLGKLNKLYIKTNMRRNLLKSAFIKKIKKRVCYY